MEILEPEKRPTRSLEIQIELEKIEMCAKGSLFKGERKHQEAVRIMTGEKFLA